MKPTNIYKHGCDPISSNCVIWQGPDIDCINLCKGDNISTVVYNLATELCTLMDTFKITNYDLSCLNLLPCEPKDFQSLIQLLIDKVCACCDVDPVPTPTGNGCPDCVVPICSEFQYTNPQGDLVTSMQLTDYVNAIGNKVCELIVQIATINLTLTNHENRITSLENASSTPSNPSSSGTVIPCSQISLPSQPTQLDIAVQQLMDQYCFLISSLGTPIDLVSATSLQCINNNTPALQGGGAMSALPGWESTPLTFEDSFRNLWVTVCDMRASIVNLLANCCSSDCNQIVIQLTAQRNGSSIIEVFATGNSSIPSQFGDCNTGSDITITDSNNNSVTYNYPTFVSAYFQNPAGVSINLANTAVDPALNLTVSLNLCVVSSIDNSQCQNISTTTVAAQGNCPQLTIISSATNPNSEAEISFTPLSSTLNTTYGVQWYYGQNAPSSQTFNYTGPQGGQTFQFTATGLVQNETYTFQVIDPSGILCPAQTYLVPGGPCEVCEITSVSVTIT